MILSSPATQSKKPKIPVTREPHTKTVPFQSCACDIAQRVVISPRMRTKGRIITADPKFVHHASWIVELLQCGRELLIRTAWKAMNREDRTP